MAGYIIAILVLAATLPTRVLAIDAILPGASQRGEATLRYFGFPVYEAELFTRNGRAFDWNDDFGLRLRYLRDFSQDHLVDATLTEFDRIGDPLPLEDELERCFYGVSRGDSYLAVTDGPDRVRFWRNGQPTCTLSYPQIKYRFMSIFLGSDSRVPGFTRALRGE